MSREANRLAESAASSCTTADIVADSSAQALTPTLRFALALNIAEIRAVSETMARNTGATSASTVRSAPNCAFAMACIWTMADKVAIALALRLTVGSGISSQAGSGTHGGAGCPHQAIQLPKACARAARFTVPMAAAEADAEAEALADAFNAGSAASRVAIELTQ